MYGIMGYSVHIGQLIKNQVAIRGCTVSWLARQLNCDRSYIYELYKRDSIDTKRLYCLCEVLECNFYKIISDAFQAERKLKRKE